MAQVPGCASLAAGGWGLRHLTPTLSPIEAEREGLAMGDSAAGLSGRKGRVISSNHGCCWMDWARWCMRK